MSPPWLTPLRDAAAILGVVTALVVYITNVRAQARQRKLDNIRRFFDAHDRLFEDGGFLESNIVAMEDDTAPFVRNMRDKEMEKKFNRLLGEVEKVALLTRNKAVSESIFTYMFGWFARKV